MSATAWGRAASCRLLKLVRGMKHKTIDGILILVPITPETLETPMWRYIIVLELEIIKRV